MARTHCVAITRSCSRSSGCGGTPETPDRTASDGSHRTALCGDNDARAEKVFALLSEGLDDEQHTKLDRLLEQREGSPYSTLAWLRMPPGAPTPRAVLGHIERLSVIRALALPTDTSQKLHQNRLLQLAREAGQTAVYQFKEYEQARCHGTLVASARLLDESSCSPPIQRFGPHNVRSLGTSLKACDVWCIPCATT